MVQYRVALVALVAVTVALITVVPVVLFGHIHDTGAVFFGLCVLGLLWATFVATSMAETRLHGTPRGKL